MRPKFKTIAIISIMTLIMLTLAGCDLEDPETGKTLFYGNLKVVNENTGAIAMVKVFENNGGNMIWEAGVDDISSGNQIWNGQSRTFTDIPAGTWRVQIQTSFLNDVVISSGMITTVTRTSGGTLVAGIPLP